MQKLAADVREQLKLTDSEFTFITINEAQVVRY